MKWIAVLMLLATLTACSWFQLDVVRDREVLVTDQPNKLLEPFTCGDASIDVTHTIRTCKSC